MKTASLRVACVMALAAGAAMLALAVCAIGLAACGPSTPSTPAVPVVGVLRGIPLPGLEPFPSLGSIRSDYVVRYTADSSGDVLFFRPMGIDDRGGVARSQGDGVVLSPQDPRPWEHDWTPVPEAALQPQAFFPLAKIHLARGTVDQVADHEWNTAGTNIFSLRHTGTFRGRSDPRPGQYESQYEWLRRDQVGTTTIDGVIIRGPGSYLRDIQFSPCFRYEAQLWFDNPRFSDRVDRFYVVIVDRATRTPVTPGVLLDAGSLDGSDINPRWTPDSRYVVMYGEHEGKVWIYPNTAWTPDNGPRPASVGPLPPNLQAPPPSPNIFPP
jgi:hypothetical protein